MNCRLKIAKRYENYISDWDYEQYLSIGGYGSGKSYHTALKIHLLLMSEKRTCLVVRQVQETLKDSCFALFKEIIENMDMLADGFHDSVNYKKTAEPNKCVAIKSPLEIRYPNGSRIIFRGMDKPEKIKSIYGVSVIWIEEASELSLQAYQELLGRAREPKKTAHYLLTSNPISCANWLYTTFFKRVDEKGKTIVIQDEQEFYEKKTLINPHNGIYYMHTIPTDNTFLPKSYIKRLDSLKEIDKQLWLVARYGRFGATGLRVLPNFTVAKNAKEFKEKIRSIPSQYHFFGLDFGFEESFNALVACCVDDDEKILYIYKEVYVNHITDDRFSQMESVRKIASLASRLDKPICADSAEPKTIQYYRQQGFNMYGAKKYIGSRLQNTKKMKRFKKIVCSPMCKNTIRELQPLTYKKDSRGNIIEDEFNIDPHTFSALWYALDTYTVADIKEIKTNSKRG